MDKIPRNNFDVRRKTLIMIMAMLMIMIILIDHDHEEEEDEVSKFHHGKSNPGHYGHLNIVSSDQNLSKVDQRRLQQWSPWSPLMMMIIIVKIIIMVIIDDDDDDTLTLVSLLSMLPDALVG